MTGHEPLIAMRRNGRAPAWVEVETTAVGDKRLAREWPDVMPERAIVLIAPGETLARLDLRCLVGLSVEVQGDDAERVAATVKVVCAAGAKRVLGTTFARRGEECRMVSMTDTEEAMAWPA